MGPDKNRDSLARRSTGPPDARRVFAMRPSPRSAALFRIRPSECCLIRRKGGRGVRLYLDRRRAGYESQFRLRRPRLCKILLVVNGIEAIPTTRLNEMIWFEETLQRVGLADGPPAGGRYLLPQNAAMSSPTHRSIQPAICAEWARWCHLRQDLSAHVRMARLCA